MKHFIIISLCAFASPLALTSCGGDGVELGEARYHPSFLWTDADTVAAHKTLEFDFSADARADAGRYAVFAFVDTAGHVIDQTEVVVFVDGVRTADNTFRITSQDTRADVSLLFLPKASAGTHRGSLQLVAHNLDRLGNRELEGSEEADAFRWSVVFEKNMNPLAKVLMWIGIATLGLLVFWMSVLRPMLFPHFVKMRKTLLVKQNGRAVGQMKIDFTGKRCVILSDKKVRRSVWQRVFVGDTYTKVDPRFTVPLKFSPRKKGAVATGAGYVVRPNPIPRAGVASISHSAQCLEIIIN